MERPLTDNCLACFDEGHRDLSVPWGQVGGLPSVLLMQLGSLQGAEISNLAAHVRVDKSVSPFSRTRNVNLQLVSS